MSPSSWIAYGVACLLAMGLTEQILEHMRQTSRQDQARHEQLRRHLRAMLEIEVIKLTPGTSIPEDAREQDLWLQGQLDMAFESAEAWPRVD